jgi:hypothetical protein
VAAAVREESAIADETVIAEGASIAAALAVAAIELALLAEAAAERTGDARGGAAPGPSSQMMRARLASVLRSRYVKSKMHASVAWSTGGGSRRRFLGSGGGRR